MAQVNPENNQFQIFEGEVLAVRAAALAPFSATRATLEDLSVTITAFGPGLASAAELRALDAAGRSAAQAGTTAGALSRPQGGYVGFISTTGWGPGQYVLEVQATQVDGFDNIEYSTFEVLA